MVFFGLESKFHRLLSADESEEKMVSSVPLADIGRSGKRTLAFDMTEGLGHALSERRPFQSQDDRLLCLLSK